MIVLRSARPGITKGERPGSEEMEYNWKKTLEVMNTYELLCQSHKATVYYRMKLSGLCWHVTLSVPYLCSFGGYFKLELRLCIAA